MSKSMHCPHCGEYVGDCGHVSGGLTDPVTLSGTCGKCGRDFSVTCSGGCISKAAGCPVCHGTGTVVVQVKESCPTCDGSGTVLDRKCQSCHGTGKISIAEEQPCPKCG